MGHQRLTVARRKQINKEQTILITLNSLIEMAAVKLAVLPAFAKNWTPGDCEVVGEVFTTLNAARKNKEFQAVIRKARRRAPLDVPNEPDADPDDTKPVELPVGASNG